MKWIVLFTLVIALVIGVLITIALATYVRELKALPTIKNNDLDDDESSDLVFVLGLFASGIFVFLCLTSCSIVFFL